jgi:hypothetical protein
MGVKSHKKIEWRKLKTKKGSKFSNRRFLKLQFKSIIEHGKKYAWKS